MFGWLYLCCHFSTECGIIGKLIHFPFQPCPISKDHEFFLWKTVLLYNNLTVLLVLTCIVLFVGLDNSTLTRNKQDVLVMLCSIFLTNGTLTGKWTSFPALDSPLMIRWQQSYNRPNTKFVFLDSFMLSRRWAVTEYKTWVAVKQNTGSHHLL